MKTSNLFFYIFSILLFLLSPACKASDQTPIDGWKETRRLLTSEARNCHAQISAFCNRDKAFIDPIIQKTLDQSFQGKMPNTRSGAKSVARRCRSSYASQQRKESNLSDLSKKIYQYYNNPEIIENENQVTVIVGPLPGKFVKHLKGGFSMRNEDNEWKLSDVAKMIQKTLKRAPHASYIKMVVYLASESTTSSYNQKEWYYSTSTKRIWVTPNRPTQAFFTDPIKDLGQFIKNASMLDIEKLNTCTLVEKNLNEAEEGCPL